MTDDTAARAKDPKGRKLFRYLPIALLVAAMAAALVFGWHRYLSIDAVIDKREQLQAFVAGHWPEALVAYALVYAMAIALSLPGGLVLTLVGGFMFGWLIGGCTAVVAATTGATLVFLIARTSLGAALAEKAGPTLARLAQGFRRDAISYLLFLRLVPLFPFWLVNLAPALFGVRFRIFIITTVIGIMPGTFAFAITGAGLDSLIEAHQATYEACIAAGRPHCHMRFDLHQLVTPQLMAAFVALGIVALIPVLVRRLAGKRFAGLDGDERLS